jgi:hypothetical protein
VRRTAPRTQWAAEHGRQRHLPPAAGINGFDRVFNCETGVETGRRQTMWYLTQAAEVVLPIIMLRSGYVTPLEGQDTLPHVDATCPILTRSMLVSAVVSRNCVACQWQCHGYMRVTQCYVATLTARKPASWR